MKSFASILFALAVVATGYAQNIFPLPAGNVGIGTTSPADRLQINSGRPIIFGSTGGNGVYGSYIGFNTAINTGVVPNTITKLGGTGQFGGAIITVDYWGNFGLQTQYAGTENAATIAYAPQFTFSSNGNLGIGTMSPNRQLEIWPSSGPAYVRLSGGGEAMELFDRSGTHFNWIVGAQYNVSNVFEITPSTSVGGATYSTPAFVVAAAGNVGIGTTNPAAKLEIAATGDNVAILKLSTERAWQFQQNGTGPSTQLSLKDLSAGKTFNIRSYYDENIASFVSDSVGGCSVILVPSGGKVGIGTTNPTEKLSVKGRIRAQEVVVDNNNWSDYVFADDYKLQSLSEVEAQIKISKHLPGVPSAQEVSGKGVSLGDMQSLLLAKIEELTLHQIELEKRVNAQQAEIVRLKAATP